MRPALKRLLNGRIVILLIAILTTVLVTLPPETLRLLQEKQDALKRMISRNVFLETAP